MEAIIGNRYIWQRILEFATDGAFILDVPRARGNVLTHALIYLRQTCKVMRDLIPQPAKISPYALLCEGVHIGSRTLCELACGNLLIGNNLPHDGFHASPTLIELLLGCAVSCGHLGVVEFFLTMQCCLRFDMSGNVRQAAKNSRYDICDAILKVQPSAGHVITDTNGSERLTDLITRLKLCGFSCYSIFAACK